MAFTLPISGTRYNLQTGNCIPKKPTAAYLAAAVGSPPASAGPPLVGHLTKHGTVNGTVDHCAASDVPTGMNFNLNSGVGSTVSLISSFELRTCEIQFEYAGTPTIGQQIQSNGTLGTIPIGGVLIDQVKGVNSGGAGEIVAKDEIAGLVTVRFA